MAPRFFAVSIAVALAAVLTAALGATTALGPVASSRVPSQARSAEGEPVGALAALQNRRLWYVDTGGPGAAVVFMHATSGSSLMWERQLPAFRAAGYRCIAYDRVGWGRSEIDAGADAASAADDLHELLTWLRVDRAHLVGTAGGAIVAIDYTLSYPERVRSLVIANSIGGVQDEEYHVLSRRLRPAPQFDALPVDVRELGPSFRAADADGTARWLELAGRSRPAVPLPAPLPPRNRITFARLAAMRVPTLLITGGADLYAPPPVLRLFAARIAGADTLVVPEAGHSAYWEQPDVFNRAVLGFLARH
jgi:pimeloyl-ACP methyl ester carboxylesterase